MNAKAFLSFAVVIISLYTEAQTVQRPKVVVGIVVDQMRWVIFIVSTKGNRKMAALKD